MYEQDDMFDIVNDIVHSASYNAIQNTRGMVQNQDTSITNDDASMITADDCLDVIFLKKCKPRKKKLCRQRPRTNRAMKLSKKAIQQRSAFYDSNPCKPLLKKKNLKKKKMVKKPKKMSLCTNRKESYVCDRCKMQDSCYEMSFDCDRGNPLISSVPGPTPTRPSTELRKQTEPKDMDLLMNILGSVDTVQADVNFNRMMYNQGDDTSNARNKDGELQKKLCHIYSLLKHRNQMCCSPPRCTSTCPRKCPPVNPWECIVQEFQRAFCIPSRCRGRKTSKRCCPPRSKSSRVRCPPCCLKSETSRRKTSMRSVRDKDLKFKSRMWLLDRNDKLERQLAKLRTQETCCCSSPPCESHYSFMLWQMLMQSLVKALVESHPAVKQDDNVCQCRLQNLSLT